MEIDTDDSPNSSPEGPFLNEYVQSEQIPEEPLGDLDRPNQQ